MVCHYFYMTDEYLVTQRCRLHGIIPSREHCLSMLPSIMYWHHTLQTSISFDCASATCNFRNSKEYHSADYGQVICLLLYIYICCEATSLWIGLVATRSLKCAQLLWFTYLILLTDMGSIYTLIVEDKVRSRSSTFWLCNCSWTLLWCHCLQITDYNTIDISKVGYDVPLASDHGC